MALICYLLMEDDLMTGGFNDLFKLFIIIIIMKYLKLHIFCLTLSDKLRRCIDASIDICVSKSLKVVHLTCNRDLASDYVRILEISQEMFDEFCYDKGRSIIVDDLIIFFELY